MFLVHGQACLKSTTHPNCTFMGGSTPPGRMFAIDVRDLLGSDWRVRRVQPRAGNGRMPRCSWAARLLF